MAEADAGVIVESDIQPFDVSEHDQAVVDIQNKLKGIQEVYDEMAYVGGVKQANVVALENFVPGIITSKRPLKTFTEDYSRNNYAVAMENIEQAKPFLIGGLIIAVGVLLYKVIKWIIDYFKNGSTGGDDKKKIPEEAAIAEGESQKLDAATKEVVDELSKTADYNEKAILDKWKKDNPDNAHIQKATTLTEAMQSSVNHETAKEKQEEYPTWNLLAEDILLGGKFFKAANLLAHSLSERLQAVDNLTKVFLDQTKKALTDMGGDKIDTYVLRSPAVEQAAKELSVVAKGDHPKAIMEALKADFVAARKNQETQYKLDIKMVQNAHVFKSEVYHPKQELMKHWEQLQGRAEEIKKLGETAKSLEGDAGKHLKQAVQEISETIAATAAMFFIVKLCEDSSAQLAKELVKRLEQDNALRVKLAKQAISIVNPPAEQKGKLLKLFEGIGGLFKGKNKE